MDAYRDRQKDVKENPEAVKFANKDDSNITGEKQVSAPSAKEQSLASQADNIEKFYNGRNPNVLHSYNSFNYIFTLRAITNDQLKASKYHSAFQSSSESSNSYIVLRSGGYARDNSLDAFGGTGKNIDGAPSTPGNFKTGSQKGKDLFIDNVQLENVMDLGIQGTSNLVTGRFTVTEPYSVGGFYEELFNGSKFAGHQHYLEAPFLLSLEFIGHKFEKDKLKTERVPKATRHFPIRFVNSRMSVNEAGSTYNVEFFAVNHEVSKTFNAVLPENLDGPTQSNPSVSSILTHLFVEMNTVQQSLQDQLKEKNKETVKENPVTEENKAATAKFGKAAVFPFQPHKYMIWFPESYSLDIGDDTQMSSDPDMGPMVNRNVGTPPGKSKIIMFDALLNNVTNDQFEAWKGFATPFLQPEMEEGVNKKDYPEYEKTLINSSDIANSRMQSSEKQTYTGFFHVPKLQDKVVEADKKIKAKRNEINELIKNMSDVSLKAAAKRRSIELELEKYFKIPKKQLDTILEGEKVANDDPSQTRATLTYQNFQDVDTDGVDSRSNAPPPENAAIDTAIEKVNKLREEYMTELSNVEKAKVKVDKAKAELKELSDQKGKVYEEKYQRYGESRNRSWQFKKGTSLDANIDKIIFDSVYSTKLDDEASDEYNQTGYINWYRIEKIAFARGFDTYTNTEVYDFHYIIQPFKVHYSSLPIPQDVYNYDTMRELAVREYNYIYTGKNLDVLEFNLDFNNAFAATAFYRKQATAEGEQGTVAQETVAIKPPPLSEILVDPASNRVGAQRRKAAAKSASATSTAPTANNASDTAKFLHDALYNTPGEKALIQSEIKIAGDPVYLLSSGVTSRAVLDATNVETKYGEVNTFSREGDILFRFGTAEDLPTSTEIASGKSTMLLDESVYSGLYKLIRVTSNFNNGVFTQDLETFRRPNQKQDYVENRPVSVTKNVSQADETKAPASEENQDKGKKKPKLKLTQEDLKNLAYHGPGALGGISQQAVVEIPSDALGLNPTALGGSVFTSVSQAQQVAQQIASGTFDAKSFTPELAQTAIESGKDNLTDVTTGTVTSVPRGRQDIGQ